MVAWYWIFVAFWFGGFMGFWAAALCHAAAEE